MYLFLADAAQAVQQIVPTPWDWIRQQLPLVGWPTIIICVIKVTWHIRGFLNDVKTRAVAAEAQVKALVDSNNELKQMLEGQVQAQKELAQSVHQLADAIHHQSDMHSEQLALIREMIGEQKLLGQNQMVIMNGFQRVVEQLIDAVKE